MVIRFTYDHKFLNLIKQVHDEIQLSIDSALANFIIEQHTPKYKAVDYKATW